MTDIVERLSGTFRAENAALNVMADAAAEITALRAEITALRAENERLRAALEKLSCKCPSNCDWEKHGDICPSWVARAALSHQEQKGGE